MATPLLRGQFGYIDVIKGDARTLQQSKITQSTRAVVKLNPAMNQTERKVQKTFKNFLIDFMLVTTYVTAITIIAIPIIGPFALTIPFWAIVVAQTTPQGAKNLPEE